MVRLVTTDHLRSTPEGNVFTHVHMSNQSFRPVVGDGKRWSILDLSHLSTTPPPLKNCSSTPWHWSPSGFAP